MNMDLILGLTGVGGAALGCMTLGWAARIMWVEKRDDKKLQAAEKRYEQRHHHRKGDPLPVAGRLTLLPDEMQTLASPEHVAEIRAALQPPWLFAGESVQGWASESAEYELLTQTAEQPASVTGEPPIDTGEIQAITEWADALIAEMQAQGNVDWHTIQAGDS